MYLHVSAMRIACFCGLPYSREHEAIQRTHPPIDPEILRLKNKLWTARQVIVHLMPEPARSILKSYSNCSSSQDVYRWPAEIAEQIIPLAVELPGPAGWGPSSRGNCPLCGNGSTQGGADGFALPEGLRRHLIGWGRNTRCHVINAAVELANERS